MATQAYELIHHHRKILGLQFVFMITIISNVVVITKLVEFGVIFMYYISKLIL